MDMCRELRSKMRDEFEDFVHYENMAYAVKNKNITLFELYRTLSDNEFKHLKIISSVMKKMRCSDGILHVNTFEVPKPIEFSQIYVHNDIEDEKEAYEDYMRIAKYFYNIGEMDLGEIFETVAKEEEMHKGILESVFESFIAHKP